MVQNDVEKAMKFGIFFFVQPLLPRWLETIITIVHNDHVIRRLSDKCDTPISWLLIRSIASL